MGDRDGLRQRPKRRDTSSSSSMPPPARRSNTDDDDEMLDGRPSGAARGADTTGGDDMSTLYRFVNQYVVRYCTRIRDALRLIIGGRRTEAAMQSTHVPPSSQARAALEILDTIQKTPFNPEVEEHEQSLRELWAILGDGSEFRRTGAHWGQLGFQGKDPATDFRGQGALGLRNMVYYSKNFRDSAKEMVSSHDATLPFAIAVINISAHLLALLSTHAGRLGNSLFEFVQSSSEALALFDMLFSLVFEEFVEFHQRAISAFVASGGNPALAIMQFNPIRARVCSQVLSLTCSFLRRWPRKSTTGHS